MRDYCDAKAMAQAMRDNLKSKNIVLSVAESLELVAQQFGFDNWNIMAAKIAKTETTPKASDGIEFFATVPIIRMFDVGNPHMKRRRIVFVSVGIHPLSATSGT